MCRAVSQQSMSPCDSLVRRTMMTPCTPCLGLDIGMRVVQDEHDGIAPRSRVDDNRSGISMQTLSAEKDTATRPSASNPPSSENEANKRRTASSFSTKEETVNGIGAAYPSVFSPRRTSPSTPPTRTLCLVVARQHHAGKDASTCVRLRCPDGDNYNPMNSFSR